MTESPPDFDALVELGRSFQEYTPKRKRRSDDDAPPPTEGVPDADAILRRPGKEP